MIFDNISIVGWLHTLLIVIALLCATVIMVTRKGTDRHRLLGRIYAVSLFAGSALSLTIYRTGVFFFPHVLAIVTMAVVTLGWLSAHFHQPRYVWKNVHLTCMLASFYLIFGGGINEIFLRIVWFRVHGKAMWIQQAHAFTLLAFVLLIVALNVTQLVQYLRRNASGGRSDTDPDALPILRKP